MNLKKCVSTLTVIALLSFSSCQKAPEEVTKENDVLNNASVVDKDSTELEYASMDEIRANADAENENNSTNVQVNYVRVSDGDSMPSYTVKKYNDNYTDIDDLVEYCYHENLSENQNCVVNYEHTDDYPDSKCKGSYSYIPEGNDVFSCLMSSNCCGLSISYGNDEYRYADSFPIVKDYQLLVGDDPSDDSYIMSDGKELKVSDAIKSAETLYNEHISKLSDNEFTYKVKELIVHQYDDGTYGFEYDMEYSDKSGNIIASCLKTYPDANGFEDGTSPWIAENDCHGYIIDSSMSVYTYQETIPLKDTETDSGTKLLTYSSAINRISSTLAISKLYSVDIAALEYVITYPAESGLITKDDVTGECIDLDTMAYLHDDNRTMEVRPFWVFRNFEYNTTSEAYSGGCIMVDALNGNVYVH